MSLSRRPIRQKSPRIDLIVQVFNEALIKVESRAYNGLHGAEADEG